MKMAEGSSKKVENTVGNGEIALSEQFLLFWQCFQKTCTSDTQKPEPVGKGLKIFHIDKPTPAEMLVMTQRDINL